MSVFISVFTLIVLFILYKYTFFFTKRRHKIFQYNIVILLLFLALIDVVMGNSVTKKLGFSFIAGLNYFLALLVFFASLKIMTIYHELDKMR